MRVKPRLEFYTYDNSRELSIGHGDDCVVLTINVRIGNFRSVILAPDEAEQLGRNLVRQARHARAAHSEALR
jgi:hypothetical protein